MGGLIVIELDLYSLVISNRSLMTPLFFHFNDYLTLTRKENKKHHLRHETKERLFVSIGSVNTSTPKED